MLRPATEVDCDAVLELGVAEEEAWFGSAESSAEEVSEWVNDEGGIATGVVDIDDAGRIRAFAAPGRHAGCLLIADPGRATSAIDVLLPWLREHGAVQVMTFGADRARVAAFERHGLRRVRSSFSLVRPADAPPLPALHWPDGIDVAPYSLGDHDDAVHALIYVDAAWASVPGHTYRDLEAWREAVRPGLRAFLVRRDEVPVGWVAGRILDGGRGYVSGLASRVPSAAAASATRFCCTASPTSPPPERAALRSTPKRRTTRLLASTGRSGLRSSVSGAFTPTRLTTPLGTNVVLQLTRYSARGARQGLPSQPECERRDAPARDTPTDERCVPTRRSADFRWRAEGPRRESRRPDTTASERDRHNSPPPGLLPHPHGHARVAVPDAMEC